MKNLILCMTSVLFFNLCLKAQDASVIMRNVDNNLTYKSMKFNGSMTIFNGGNKQEKTFISYAKGNNNMYSEFTNSSDKGTKYLKKDGTLYMYLPDMEEVVPIVGHMLKQSMMGSDMSYEDASGNDTLESQYDVKVKGESEYEGIKVWVLELSAKKNDISYQRRMLWVNKENYTPLKEEFYAASGKLLKEMTFSNTIRINNKYFPTLRIMKDLLRKNTRTEFEFKNLEMDIEIPDNMFSLKNLEK
jgi:outer membrane lipoprotein-sorting protein